MREELTCFEGRASPATDFCRGRSSPAAGGQRIQRATRSGGREEREHDESRIAAAAVRSRGWGYQSSKIRPGVGYWADCWFGPYPMWPKRVGYTYPIQNVSIFSGYCWKHIRDVSGAYPYPTRFGYGYS